MKFQKKVIAAGAASMACLLLLPACSDRVEPTTPAPDEAALVSRERAAGADIHEAVQASPMTADEVGAPVTAVRSCNVERLSGTLMTGEAATVTKGSAAPRLSGWIADTETGIVPERAFLRLLAQPAGGMWQVAFEPGSPRGDVHQLLGGAAGLERAGFGVSLDLDSLPEGTYRLFLAYAGNDGVTRVCDNGRTLVVTAG